MRYVVHVRSEGDGMVVTVRAKDDWELEAKMREWISDCGESVHGFDYERVGRATFRNEPRILVGAYVGRDS